MVVSKGIKHTILKFCTHLYQEGGAAPITKETEKGINEYFKKSVAKDLKCLFFSYKQMSMQEYE
jgi:hypothetical protein